MIREVFRTIGDNYAEACEETYGEHELAAYIRIQAPKELSIALADASAGLKIVGSAGNGRWATIPWLAVFIPHVTESASEGYYIVYGFSPNRQKLVLSLNQGATAVFNEYGKGRKAREVLRDRAALMRTRVPDFSQDFSSEPIDFGRSAPLPLAYEAGHAFGRVYDIGRLPEEEQLVADLRLLVKAYRSLDFRGGLDHTQNTTSINDEIQGTTRTLLETRRYGLHRRIERCGSAPRKAKELHGYKCQACGVSLNERYGAIGDGYIEAHHLVPLSTLNEGEPTEYDIALDFCVLCSNCHRMIHRTIDPSDLASFRELLIE